MTANAYRTILIIIQTINPLITRQTIVFIIQSKIFSSDWLTAHAAARQRFLMLITVRTKSLGSLSEIVIGNRPMAHAAARQDMLIAIDTIIFAGEVIIFALNNLTTTRTAQGSAPGTAGQQRQQ